MNSKPYFCDGSDQMLALEQMVDDVGMANVLYALARISQVKAERDEDQADAQSAQWWTKRAHTLGATASMPFMHDAA